MCVSGMSLVLYPMLPFASRFTALREPGPIKSQLWMNPDWATDGGWDLETVNSPNFAWFKVV